MPGLEYGPLDGADSALPPQTPFRPPYPPEMDDIVSSAGLLWSEERKRKPISRAHSRHGASAPHSVQNHSAEEPKRVSCLACLTSGGSITRPVPLHHGPRENPWSALIGLQAQLGTTETDGQVFACAGRMGIVLETAPAGPGVVLPLRGITCAVGS